MDIVCLDLEGVLVPEIWIAFAEETGIPELKRTTRDEPDYNKLMNYRLNILREHGLGLKEIQETISKIDPLPGAREWRPCCNGSTRRTAWTREIGTWSITPIIFSQYGMDAPAVPGIP